MSELIGKLSNYNIFNYLLPGIIFVFLAETFTSITIYHDEIVVMFFIYYFIGSVISRIGSICIEPILKKIANHTNYEDYVKASKADKLIVIFSEQNNMYRTFISMSACLILIFIYDVNAAKLVLLSEYIHYLIVVCLLLLFVLAYRKQTMYVCKRVNSQTVVVSTTDEGC